MTDLYRLFGVEDRLLYVGISLNAAARASQHRSDKSWWGEVQRIEVERIDGDRSAALRRHIRRGEPVDDACRAAWADYHRERRQQQQ